MANCLLVYCFNKKHILVHAIIIFHEYVTKKQCHRTFEKLCKLEEQDTLFHLLCFLDTLLWFPSERCTNNDRTH